LAGLSGKVLDEVVLIQPPVAVDSLGVQERKVVVNSDCLVAWNFHQKQLITDKYIRIQESEVSSRDAIILLREAALQASTRLYRSQDSVRNLVIYEAKTPSIFIFK
jgi:hypothetical protein